MRLLSHCPICPFIGAFHVGLKVLALLREITDDLRKFTYVVIVGPFGYFRRVTFKIAKAWHWSLLVSMCRKQDNGNVHRADCRAVRITLKGRVYLSHTTAVAAMPRIAVNWILLGCFICVQKVLLRVPHFFHSGGSTGPSFLLPAMSKSPSSFMI